MNKQKRIIKIIIRILIILFMIYLLKIEVIAPNFPS
jgi:hypothetical protein